MLNADVLSWLKSNRRELQDQYFQLLRFPSVANVQDPDGCRPCAEWLVEKLKEMGFSAEVLQTSGQPVAAGEWIGDPNAPTVLLYAHYDVQPPDPLDEWTSEPFEPELRDGIVYARGAADDKSGVMMHLGAIQAWVRAAGRPPVNLKVLFEGAEEIGSPGMEKFLSQNAERFAADALIISDGTFYDETRPGICTALRGLCYFEVAFTGPDRDLHSGLAGGLVRNPANALAAMIGKMHDADGRVQLPGFYDAVRPLSPELRNEWDKLNFDENQHARALGLDALTAGEAGLGALERNWARPTLDCNGLLSGYVDPGCKTVLPARAMAKISCRLVADQNPDDIAQSFRRFVAEHTPAGIRSEVKEFSSGRPAMLAGDGPAYSATREAFQQAFGVPPVGAGSGASIPIVEIFQRILGLDGVVAGLALPASQCHSPNENLPLEQIWRGMEAAASFYQNFPVKFHATT